MEIIPHKVALRNTTTGRYHCALLAAAPAAHEDIAPGQFCRHQCFYVDPQGWPTAAEAADQNPLDREAVATSIISEWNGADHHLIQLPLRLSMAELVAELTIDF